MEGENNNVKIVGESEQRLSINPNTGNSVSTLNAANMTSPATPSASKKRGTLVREQLKFCSVILKVLKKHRDSFPFLQPVDPVALNIPDYFNVIKQPMDLGTIGKKLDQVAYETAEDFIADVRLLLQNCYTYNGPDSPVTQMGKNLEKAFENELKKMPTAESIIANNSASKDDLTSPTQKKGPSSSALSNSVNNTPVNNKKRKQIFSNTTPGDSSSPRSIKRQNPVTGSAKKAFGGYSSSSSNPVQDQKKFCGSVLKELLKPAHQGFSWPFLQPVDPITLGIPDYFTVIKEPMDLSTIKKKYDAGTYKTCDEFKYDVDLMFQNCYSYNPPDSDVVEMARKLEGIFKSKWSRKPDFSAINNNANDNAASEDFSEEESEEISRLSRELSKIQSQLAELIEKRNSRKSTSSNPKKRSAPNGNSGGAAKKSASSPYNNVANGTDHTETAAPALAVVEFTFEDKKKLSEDIGELTAEQQLKVVEIIQNSMPKLTAENGQDEIELDVEMLDIKTLTALKKYVTDVQNAALARKKKRADSKNNSTNNANNNMNNNNNANGASMDAANNVKYDSEEESSSEDEEPEEDHRG